MLLRLIALAIPLAFSSHSNADDQASEIPWITGFWYATAPEDKDIKGTVMEFRADGSYILYDKDCYPENEPNEVTYRDFGDEIQVQNHPIGEKPSTLVFRPRHDRKILMLEFPDSNQVATVERLPGNRCAAQS